MNRRDFLKAAAASVALAMASPLPLPAFATQPSFLDRLVEHIVCMGCDGKITWDEVQDHLQYLDNLTPDDNVFYLIKALA